MDKLHIIGQQIWSMRANVKDSRIPVLTDDIKRDLIFWLRQSFPCLSDVKGLLFGSHFGR